MGKKADRLGGRYGGEPEKAIADPGNENVENPVIQSSVNGGSNKSIRRPKEEVKMPKLKDLIERSLQEKDKKIGWDKTIRQEIQKYNRECSKSANEIVVKSRMKQVDVDGIIKAADHMTYMARLIKKYAKSYATGRGDNLNKPT